MDVLIYTTEEKLLHKQGKLEGDVDHSENGFYYWEFWNLPKIEVGDRVYFATKRIIRGFFIVTEIDRNQRFVIWNCASWRRIRPVMIKGFQGFKYIVAKRYKEFPEKKICNTKK